MTGLPSMVTATAAPTSPRLSKLSANAARTLAKRASQLPSIVMFALPCGSVRWGRSERRVNRIDQRAGAGIDQDVWTHLVHGVAKADFGVRIGEAERAASPRMTEAMLIRADLVVRLREHETGAEAGRHHQNFIFPMRFFGIA